MIYHYHLTSERILPRHTSITKRWTPIDLLYVCRTIYNEAFFHLYTKGDFVIQARPEPVFALATCRETKDINGSVGLETFVRSKKIMHLIRYIDLEIHWPSVQYARSMSGGFGWNIATTITGEMTMETVGAMLSNLPALRTINVSWCHMTVCASEPIEAAPPKYRFPLLLRGLKHVRRRNENVLIRLPAKGPMSTEELAEEQSDIGEVLNCLREVRENIEDLEGSLRDELY